VKQEREPPLDLAQRALGDAQLVRAQRQRGHVLVRALDRERRDLVDAAPGDAHRERLRAHALALAGLAARLAHELGVVLAHGLRAGLPVAAHQAVQDALELEPPAALVLRALCAPDHLDLLVAQAVEHLIALLLG
jgi:hypothetical protein